MSFRYDVSVMIFIVVDLIVVDFNRGSELLIYFDFSLHCNDKSFCNKF